MAKDYFPSPHPLTPPHSEEDTLSWLRLLRSRRVGISTFYRLLAEHGSAQEALAALPDIARDAGVSSYQICPEGVVLAELKAGRLAGARLIANGQPGYPAALSDLADAPPLIWVRGNKALLGRPMIALVGARNASSLGMRMARKMAGELAEAGYIVVSGLARGIDTAAHQAALERGTVAVMAGGVDVIYPAENAVLAQEIETRGLLLSEQPIGLAPMARHFPMRNRIISGLSEAVVVIEAAPKSGSLITARNALDQGRDVLAVPGHPLDARAGGSNMLIRDGATLVRSAADVIEALADLAPKVAAAQRHDAPDPAAISPDAPPAQPAPPKMPRSLAELAALHSEILGRLGPSPLAEDQLMRDLNLNLREITPALTDLELEGKIARQPGGLLSIR
ncbi:MAG: DNA-processing protein DprA [Paracoccaceae bacterium]